MDPGTGCPRASAAELRPPRGEASHVDRGDGTAWEADAGAWQVPGSAKAGGGGLCEPWRLERTEYLKRTLTARVYDVAQESPLEAAAQLSDQLGCEVLLKREDIQQVFSFKLRGAFNKMASLSREELRNGVVCSSAGNHAQGVALGARQLGCEATICMPLTTPQIKVQAVRRLGARVELVGKTYDACQAHALRLAEEEGLAFIHPFDDPYTICGQGTIGVEVLRQCPDLANLHAIFVPVGGGGLLAGIAAFVKQVAPEVLVFGVEPEDSNCLAVALDRGHRVTLDKIDGFADGVAVKTVGAETFRVAREFCDGVIQVGNDEICAAIKDVFTSTRSILEPAGAVGLAGLKAYAARHREELGLRPGGGWGDGDGGSGGEQGSDPPAMVAILSGANMNFDRLRVVSELANVGAKREVMLATSIPETPGAFKKFVAALAGNDAGEGGPDVTEFKYRFAVGEEAHILYSLAVQGEAELQGLMSRLEAAGLGTMDLSNCGPAQMHLRHLVGGRARSFTGPIPDEQLFSVTFPERPGALTDFLNVLAPGINITLFHYRNTGNNESQVLVGVQEPPKLRGVFEEELLELKYKHSRVEGLAQEAFELFLY